MSNDCKVLDIFRGEFLSNLLRDLNMSEAKVMAEISAEKKEEEKVIIDAEMKEDSG